jgi:hypothetical protein
MPQVGFELTIPVFERAKTVHALDRAATVIGVARHRLINYISTQMELTREFVCSFIVDLINR